MWEIRYVDRKSKESVVISRVASFALANTLAKEMPNAEGKMISVRRVSIASDVMFGVYLYMIDSGEWVRLESDLTRRETARFQARFQSNQAIAVYWPIGVDLPSLAGLKQLDPANS
jgi:hypothetical protein